MQQITQQSSQAVAGPSLGEPSRGDSACCGDGSSRAAEQMAAAAAEIVWVVRRVVSDADDEVDRQAEAALQQQRG